MERLRSELDNSYLLHAVRADLLRRLGRFDDAACAYDAAIARAANVRERGFLQRRLEGLGGTGMPGARGRS